MAHGGLITVDSKAGMGTTLDVYFPEHQPERPLLDVATERPRPVLSRPLRVLVVDDEEPVMRVATRMLAYGGIEATGVVTGAEALEHLARAPGSFDVAIVDLAMPGMSGLELSVKLRTLSPELWVYLASGNTTNLRPEDIERAGIRGALDKPFRLRTLLEAMEEVSLTRERS
jgi:CheY-like chemotaxis protein